MKKLIKAILFILALALLLTSCSHSKRINDLTVVQGFGIDEKNGKTAVSLQYLNLFENSGNTESLKGNITKTLSFQGYDISSSVSSASDSVSNDIFFGQNKVVVFGMSYAKSSIDKGIEYLLTSSDSRPDVIAAISKTSAEDIIKCEENGAKIPAENIYNLLRLGEENGSAAAVAVCEMLNLYSDETSDLFLPVLSAENNNVSCVGIAVFSDAKYVKTLDKNETRGFLFVQDKIKNGTITVNCEKLGFVSLDIISSKTKKSAEINGTQTVFNIEIKTKLKISETETPVNKRLSDSDFEIIKSSCEKEIEKICESAVSECFKARSDPFMLARYVYMRDKELYSSLKPDWRNYLPFVKINVSVNTEIQRIE